MKEMHTKKSKFITYVLRHSPGAIQGLVISTEGWAPISAFVPAFISLEELHEMVSTDSKGRFEIRGQEIRCKYGHSNDKIQVEQKAITSQIPTLWHATTSKAYESIKVSGILPMARNLVHMAEDRQLAVSVALRYAKNLGDVVVLRIKNPEEIEGLHHHDNIWLAPSVPTTHFEKD